MFIGVLSSFVIGKMHKLFQQVYFIGSGEQIYSLILENNLLLI